MREPILGSERTFTLRIVCCLVGVVYSGFMGMQAKEGYVVSELKSTSAVRSQTLYRAKSKRLEASNQEKTCLCSRRVFEPILEQPLATTRRV